MTKVKFRLLSDTDKDDYLGLMSFFNKVEMSQTDWEIWFDSYMDSDKEVWIGTINDITLGTIVVCTGAIIYEDKIFHNAPVAHIEDIVVHEKYRGLGIGKVLMKHLIKTSKDMFCYKAILSCSQKNIGFYESCGFRENEQEMRIDL